MFALSSSQDLNRQVVRADSASLTVPELDFEVPAHRQEGGLTTVEDTLTRAVEGLGQDQPLRRVGGAGRRVNVRIGGMFLKRDVEAYSTDNA